MDNKTILVTGGAGFVGSHCVAYLKESGFRVIVLDNLSRGAREAALGDELVVGDVGDAALLDRLFSENQIDAVMHFASLTYVGESVKEPAMYYANNVAQGLALLEAMACHGVSNLVFSSTAAVYGEPESVPISEDHPLRPVNPYGYSKMVFERMAMDMAASRGLRPVFLRYFNAAGAHPGGLLGEDHNPETHLIPIVIDAALGRRESVTVFGSDYPTADGTCVRDYVHVMDLASAHARALEYLDGGGGPDAFNLGSETGYSVRQVIEAVSRISGRDVPVTEGPRRDGDPSTLVASSEKARNTLGWRRERSGLDIIAQDAFSWRLAHPDGYKSRKA